MSTFFSRFQVPGACSALRWAKVAFSAFAETSLDSVACEAMFFAVATSLPRCRFLSRSSVMSSVDRARRFGSPASACSASLPDELLSAPSRTPPTGRPPPATLEEPPREFLPMLAKISSALRGGIVAQPQPQRAWGYARVTGRQPGQRR